MKSSIWFIGALLAAALGVSPPHAQAQVVREDGVKSIAGVLVWEPAVAPQSQTKARAEWSFKSSGGEILFASLDADIYRVFGEHTEAVVTAAADSGCGGEDEGGGPFLFRLSVVDAYDREVCSASRPAPPPGWMRDPRLSCVLPTVRQAPTYRLRVELKKPSTEVTQTSFPFVLNLSLRKIAVSGTNIQSAVAASSAGGF